jgi:hypothetical protein
LPIEKIDTRYAVKFEREFSFEPDFLFFAVFKTLEESKINGGFIVEVEKCNSTQVIHSFEAGRDLDIDNTACKQRLLPTNCYVFYFTDTEHAALADSDEQNSSLVYLLGALLIIGACVLLYLKMRDRKPKMYPDLISIGEYQFHEKEMLLSLDGKSTELSSKESELLLLLISNENKTLEREYILNAVWEDEGNYVGRTLDVFISKLRKKLEADPNIKIINIRGVGYRFVINR